MKILSLENKVTEGNYFFNGNLIDKNNELEINYFRSNFGFIYQDFKLISDLNVFENIAYPLEIKGIYTEKEIRNKVLHSLESVGMVRFTKRFINELSGGEKQRVAIARALSGDFKIIIADEPLANLDPSNSNEVINCLEKINKLGHTIIIATHNEKIVNSLNYRVIELDKGKLIRDEKGGKYSKK